MAKVGDLGLVLEAGSIRTREECGNDFHPKKYTGPWTVKTSSMDRSKPRKKTKNRKTGKLPVAVSALILCNDGWHADGHFHRCGQLDSS